MVPVGEFVFPSGFSRSSVYFLLSLFVGPAREFEGGLLFLFVCYH